MSAGRRAGDGRAGQGAFAGLVGGLAALRRAGVGRAWCRGVRVRLHVGAGHGAHPECGCGFRCGGWGCVPAISYVVSRWGGSGLEVGQGAFLGAYEVGDGCEEAGYAGEVGALGSGGGEVFGGLPFDDV